MSQAHHRESDVGRPPKRSQTTKPAQARQVAALVFRVSREQGLEILLLTSLETRRAVIPKGWPMMGEPHHEAAAREAYEEGGIVGKIARKPIGAYKYWKRSVTGTQFVRVALYPLELERQCEKWPEQRFRETRWYTPADAALLVDEPALAILIRCFTIRSPRGNGLGKNRLVEFVRTGGHPRG
jgi:8-oxo-dGTP pyrophosphatase MutT (NUDIX family)